MWGKEMDETVLEYLRRYYGDFVSLLDARFAPLEEWRCLSCGNSFLGRFPKIDTINDKLIGRCPWCWNDNLNTIVRDK